MRPFSFSVTLAKVSDGEGGRACQYRLHRDMISSGYPKMPRSDSCLGEGTLYSPKDAEIIERGIKHRSTPQECILLKPVSLLLQTMLAVGREDFFDVQM